MCRRRGFTLVEMLIAIAILSLATAMMGVFFSFFTRQMMRYEGRQDLILQAEKAMVRIQATLASARSSLVTAAPTISGFYFPTAVAANGALQFNSTTGALAWQGWVGYGYSSTSSTLFEATNTWATADAAGSAPTVAVASWSQRVLAHSVTAFSYSGPTNAAYSFTLVVDDGRGYRAQFTSTIVAPN